MLRQAKFFICSFFTTVTNKLAGTSPMNITSNALEFKIESRLKPLIIEDKVMLRYNDLLTLKREKFMVNDFCTLRKEDSLAKAHTFLGVLQRSGYIVIVDSNDKFTGVISDISILREFPPDEKTISCNHQINDPNLHMEVISSVASKADKLIQDILILEPHQRRFYKDGAIIDILQELEKSYSYYAQRKVIPLLNTDDTVAGIISYKEILKFIQEKKVLDNQTIKDAFLDQDLEDNMCIIKPENTLASAYFMIKYLPTECILICDQKGEKKILRGWLDKRKISTMVHPLYSHLRNISLIEIMEPASKLYLIEPGENLSTITNYFLKTGKETAVEAVVIVENKTASEISPIGIITPINILQFFINFI